MLIRHRFAWLYELARSESGAAYMLGTIMTWPFFALLILLALETTLLLATRMGATYALDAAMRSASVWLPAEPKSLGPTRIRLAAVQAMTPFASGNSMRLGPAGSPTEAQVYAQAYHRFAPRGPIGDRYLLTKWRYAERATELTWRTRPVAGSPWEVDVEVVVSFEHALLTPIFGRIVGQPREWGGRGLYTYTVRAIAATRLERPRNDLGTLGIRYLSE